MDETARLALPLLYAGQAQKEQFHNEALTLADALIGATAVARQDAPPAAPEAGQCWVVGDAPIGIWAGHAQELAIWTAGGWRFRLLPPGFQLWLSAAGVPLRRTSGGWTEGEIDASGVRIDGVQVLGARGAAIGEPIGGTIVDAEARSAIAAILNTLRQHGLIASS